MDEIEFLEIMLNYETIDKACRTKNSFNKEKNKKLKNLAAKKSSLKKHGQDWKDEDAKPGKYRNSSLSARKTKKYCFYCKENDRKHWTHDTELCFVKDKVDKANKESNVIKAL